MQSRKCIFRRGVTDANGAKTFAGRAKKTQITRHTAPHEVASQQFAALDRIFPDFILETHKCFRV